MKLPIVVLRFNLLNRQGLHEYHSLAKQAKTTGSFFRVLSRQEVRALSTANDKGDKLRTATAESNKGGQLQKSILEEVLLKEDKKPTTFTGKVVEKTTNTFLYVAVAGAVALLGAFAYLLAGEFFAQDSPQAIFSKALALVRDDGRCLDLFGNTIAGFGEENSRGRRRHVAHHKYEKDGKDRIRVLFHIKGDRDEGIAQAEMELREGTWEWRFLYVETKSRPKTTHVLIDNRFELGIAMEDGGFTLVTKKSGKCNKPFLLPPEGSKEGIEKALVSARKCIEDSRLCDWLIMKINQCSIEKVERIYVVGNGHFDGNWCPGAHQLALCLKLTRNFQCNLYFQEIVCTNTEVNYLKDLDNVVVIAPQPGFVRVKDHNFVEVIVMIHGIHELMEDYLKLNWGDNLKKTLFVCNAYMDVGLAESNFPYLKKFTTACEGFNLPSYEHNPVFFSQTSILYIPTCYEF